MSAAFDGTIVLRKANTMIPSLYLEKVIEANPHGWGAAMHDKDDSLMVRSDIDPATAVDVVDAQKEFMDRDITFYFCNSENALSVADVSPHVILAEKDGKEEIPKVVALVTGNFPSFDKPQSSHSAIFHFVEDMLIPKFEGLAEMCENDLDKITDAIKKPYFKKELLLNSLSRGTITVIAANGVSVTFDQNDLSAEYPWGWTSNTHGYVEGDGVKEGAPAPKKGLFKRSTVREAAPSAKIAEVVTAPKTETAVIKNYSFKKWAPSPMQSRKEKRNAYKEKIGYIPPKWEDCVEVNIYLDPQGRVLTFAQMNKALGLEATKLIREANNPARGKDTENDHIEDEDRENGPAVSTEILPIMSPENRKKMLEYHKSAPVQKIIAENADIIDDPKKVQGLEKMFVDFGAQLGLKYMDDFLRYDYEQFLHLASNNPQAAANMTLTFRNMIAKSRNKEGKLTKEEVHVVASEELKPAKKGLFKRSA